MSARQPDTPAAQMDEPAATGKLDETARYRAALEDSERRLSVALASTHMGAWDWDLLTDRMVWNAREYELMGLPLGDGNEPAASLFRRVHPDDQAALRRGLTAVWRNGSKWCDEFRVIRACGEVRWLAATGRVDRSLSGEPRRMIGVHYDITEQKLREQALRESRQLLRAVVEGTSDAVFIKDARGRYVLFNEAASLFVRKRPEDVLGHDDTFLFSADEAKLVMERERAIMAGGKAITYEEEVTTADGVKRTFSVTKGPMHDENGTVTGVFGIARDVTASKQAEAALRESEERFRRLVEVSSHIVWVTDAQGLPLEDSPTWRAFTGRSLEQWMGWSWLEAVHPDDRASVAAAWKAALASRRPYQRELRMLHHSGQYHYVTVQAAPLLNPDGSPRAWIGMNVDITERKQTEAAVQESRELLSADLEAMTRLQEVGRLFIQQGNLDTVLSKIVETAIAIAGADSGCIQFVEEKTAELKLIAQRGLAPEWVEFWHRVPMGRGAAGLAFASRERAIIEDLERSPLLAGTQDLQVPLRAGVRALQSTPLFGRSGKPLGVLSTHYKTPRRPSERVLPLLDLLARQTADIIERAQIEAALRQSEHKSRSAFSHAAIGFAIKTPEGAYVDANPAYCALTGYSLEELQQLRLQSLVHPDDLAINLDTLRRLLTGEIPGMVVENRYVRKSGAPIWVRKSLSVVRGADQAPEWIIVLIEDITARKQSEELAKAKDASDEANRQKDQFLATLGHELRNPLSGIRNVVDLMKRWSPVEPRWQRARDLIDGQLTHMTRLIDDLLDVSRVAMGKIVLQKEKLDLVALVRTTVEDHRTQVDAVGLQMELVAPTAPLWVYGDATRLAQLVSNLLVNACKFTDRGGRVTVALQSDSAGSAELTVHDTGIGMDAATLEAVFSPFAQADRSLARSQGGLGLGLALVRGLAELHDGAVSCSSPGLGRGSEFRVCLPLSSTEGAEGDEAGAPPELPAPHEPPQRVLIIEDNVVAADSLKTLLEMAGHSVTVAHTGREGIRQAREHRPDTVLCDVGLPGGMDGYAVARALRADPELASVYLIAMTGYGQEEDRRRAKAAGFDVHLTKPADVVTVRRLLAR